MTQISTAFAVKSLTEPEKPSFKRIRKIVLLDHDNDGSVQPFAIVTFAFPGSYFTIPDRASTMRFFKNGRKFFWPS